MLQKKKQQQHDEQTKTTLVDSNLNEKKWVKEKSIDKRSLQGNLYILGLKTCEGQ